MTRTIQQIKNEELLYMRKVKRARRIIRIRRLKQIDTWIKNRVYIITIFLSAIIFILFIPNNKLKQKDKDLTQSYIMIKNLMNNFNHDILYKQNKQLLNDRDSMQVLLFVYNRRHQRDQAQIFALTNYEQHVPIIKPHIENDSSLLDIKYDSLFLDTELDSTIIDSVKLY